MEQTKKANSRNGFIDILRVVFALLVVEYHLYDAGDVGYPLGKIGVEYFVILSGFLFFLGWKRRVSSEASLEDRLCYWKNYMVQRFFRFFWYALIAFIVTFLVVRVWRDGIVSVGGLANALSGDIWEILLIKMNGLNRGANMLNGPVWTLSSMLLAEFFILGMLTWGSKFFLSFFMPASMLCGFGYWVNMEVAAINKFLGLFTFGTLRVYLLTCFGIVSYLICEKILKQVEFTVLGRWLLTFIEVATYIGVLIVAYNRNSRNWQFVCICSMSIAIAIGFSKHSYTSTIFKSNRVTNFLADYSFGVYLIHKAVLYVLEAKYPDVQIQLEHEGEFIVAVIVIGLIYTLFMYGFMRALPHMKKTAEFLLIQPKSVLAEKKQ